MSSPNGILIVDKPGGMTSHDVVARVRKRLHTRKVGHAGTLDPMATGVLVVLVGEGTKLEPYLGAAHKRYRATIALGVETDTLDAEGTPTQEIPFSADLAEELLRLASVPPDAGPIDLGELRAIERALQTELQRREQHPPAFSAIQVDGVRSYDRARRGEAVDLPARPVTLQSAFVVGATPSSIAVELETSKGYYVRSFARDFAASLGTVGHLSALRRVGSGGFSEAEACALDFVDGSRLLPLTRALAQSRVPILPLDDAESKALAQGKRVAIDVTTRLDPERLQQSAIACVDSRGGLVAMAAIEEGALRSLRGFDPGATTDRPG